MQRQSVLSAEFRRIGRFAFFAAVRLLPALWMRGKWEPMRSMG